MKGLQNKINRLCLAFQQKGRVIRINSNQVYSTKFKKVFNIYKVQESTLEEIELRRKIWELKKDLKEKGIKTNFELEEMKDRVNEISVDDVEIKSKVDVLIHLAERYKVICDV